MASRVRLLLLLYRNSNLDEINACRELSEIVVGVVNRLGPCTRPADQMCIPDEHTEADVISSIDVSLDLD